jgi:hypothetical protein
MVQDTAIQPSCEGMAELEKNPTRVILSKIRHKQIRKTAYCILVHSA